MLFSLSCFLVFATVFLGLLACKFFVPFFCLIYNFHCGGFRFSSKKIDGTNKRGVKRGWSSFLNFCDSSLRKTVLRKLGAKANYV
jgi:hypothetical protein